MRPKFPKTISTLEISPRKLFQLEKTKNDIQSDLHDMEYRLDHEGKEFHHYDEFCQLYRAEIINLNRTLVREESQLTFLLIYMDRVSLKYAFNRIFLCNSNVNKECRLVNLEFD